MKNSDSNQQNEESNVYDHNWSEMLNFVASVSLQYNKD